MIRGLLFDINGTLTDILTNEADDGIYRTLANFFLYHGVSVSAQALRDDYFDLNAKQRDASKEEFPEFDVVKIFDDILKKAKVPVDKKEREKLALTAAEIYRASSMYRLQLYPNVKQTLATLKKKYRLGAVSDGQSAWAKSELAAVGLGDTFETLVVSGDYGYRKPDLRLYQKALKEMNLSASEVIFIGNDLYRDVYGANLAGMKSVFFKSNQGDHDFLDAKPDYVIFKFEDLEKAVAFLDK